MEKEADIALRWRGGRGVGGVIGKPVNGEAVAFPESTSNLEPMLSSEKARQLPRKMWMIVAAACLAWAIIIAVGYFILV